MSARRRPVNKTFSGCARCKASKVKCDEAKPSCSRCNSRALPCPGYPRAVIRWSTKHEVFNSCQAPDTTPARNPPPSRPLESAQPRTSPASQKVIRIAGTALSPRRRSSLTPHSPADGSQSSPKGDNAVALARASDFHGSLDEFTLGSSLSTSSATYVSTTNPSWPMVMRPQEYHGWPTTNLGIPSKTSIPTTISHLPATLVSYYFQDVCSVFSSFDSDLNPFRSYVSQVFSYSAPVFNAMMSSSAARLADKNPQLKIVGLQYQSLALRCIAESLKKGNEIPEDTLFAIFLIGLSTAWHDGRDIGLAHFHAAQRAISSNLITLRGNNQSLVDFFKSALIYWEMALSLVSDEVKFTSDVRGAIGDTSDIATKDTSESSNIRIVPHPWTGVSSQVQIIFSRVARVIRSLGFVKSLSDRDLLKYQRLGEDAEKLEIALWSLELPTVADIDDSGDPNTPASHHILLAEAYIFGALYQIYRKFPDVLGRRRDYLSAMTWPPLLSGKNPISDWYISLPNDACDKTLLRSLGFSILDRLQQIQITSGTRSVQAILIFVAAGSLEIPSPFTVESSLLGDQAAPLDAALEWDSKRVMELREFTISRLSSLRKLVHSRPVDLMLQVIKEMYRRLDAGDEVFWIDVIHEMKCETMLG